MDGIEKERKKITFSIIINYVIGAILLLIGVAGINAASYISGLLFILAAIVTIKPTMGYVESRLNFSLSKAAKFFVVFCLVVVAFATVPTDNPATDNGNEGIAESSDSVSTQTTTINSRTYACEVTADNYECENWSSEKYPEIWIFGEKYVPLFSRDENIWDSHINKLAKPVLDSNTKLTLRTGETLDLGEGYALEAKTVDVDGQKVWFEFRHNGEYLTDYIVSIDDSSEGTWNVEFDDLQDEDNIIVFRIHVSEVFFGAADSIALIDGVWLIDYATAETLKVGDTFGNYTLKEISNGVDETNLGSLVFEYNDAQNNEETASSIITAPKPTTGAENKESIEETKTYTKSGVEYQDEEWLTACWRNAPIVADDLRGYADAASNTDYSSLATYSDLLYRDSQTALNESEMYSVSPDLQKAKDEYRLAMVQANWCAVYTGIAINYINDGNTDGAITSMNQAAEALKSCNEHTTTANRLLDEYKSK